MGKIIQFFIDLWTGIQDWFQEIWILVLTWFKDFSLWLFEMSLDVLAFMFEQLEPPELLATGLQTLFNNLPESVIYFLGQSGLSEGIAILGGAYVFRLLRKVLTLGIW